MRQGSLIALIAVLLFALGSGVAYQRLSTVPERIPVENCLFGADAQEFRTGMEAGAFNVVGKQKHFLARQYLAAAVRGQEAIGVPARQGWLNAAAAVGGAFLASGLLLLLGLGQRLRVAVPGSLLLGASNAVAIHYAIPETYLLTGTLCLLALWAIVRVDRSRLSPWGRTGGVTLAVGIAALAHLPAAALLLVHGVLELCRRPGLEPGPLSSEREADSGPGLRPGRRGWLGRVSAAAAIALFIGLAPSLFLTGTGWANDYVRDYASLAGFSDAAVLGDYLATIGLFSMMAPFDACACRYVAADAVRLLADPWRLLLLAGVLGGFMLGLARLRGSAHAAFIAGLAAWFGVTALFYLWFFPYEAMLPGLLFAIPIGLTLTLGLAQWRHGWIGLGLLAFGLAMANDPQRWPSVDRFGQCCPRERWSPWPLTPERWLPPEQL
jgi:hypothetical protein